METKLYGVEIKELDTTGAPGGTKAVALVSLLVDEIGEAVRAAGWYTELQERNRDVFYCWWEGQSLDGRKHQEDQGKDPFPWEGASDTRVRLAEDIVNDDCRVMQAAVRGWMIEANRTGVEDEKVAAGMVKVLRWQLRQKMRGELRREAELVRQWRQVHGASLTRITWLERARLERRVIGLLEVIQYLVTRLAGGGQRMEGRSASLAGDGGQRTVEEAEALMLAEVEARGLLFDPGREAELVFALEAWIPGVAKREWRRAAREWRGRGESVEIRAPYVSESRPCWRAFRVWDSVFFPPDVADLQASPWVAVREWLTRGEVGERALAEDWSESFEAELLKHPGVTSVRDIGDGSPGQFGAQGVQRRSGERMVEEIKDRYEVWTMYRKAEDENGVAGIFCTVFSSVVNDEVGVEDELLDYAHGKYPFVAHRREVKERALLESRGAPEIVMTWQSEVKVQRDARTDRASMDTLPPIEAPMSAARQKLNFGPKAVNYTRTPGSLRFIQMTGQVQSSVEMEERTMAEVNWFFGRIAENVPPSRRQLYLQGLIDDYLEEMAECLVMTWQLCDQFLDAAEVARLLGSEELAAAVKSRSADELRGEFDVELRFNAENVDLELLLAKMKVINEIAVPLDVAGVIDRARLARWVMYAVDAPLAEEVVKPMEAVTQAEINDEQVQLAKIAAGIEAPYVESGQNAELRLQTIRQTVAANPQWQQRLAQDETFKALLEARAQHFQHMLDQRANAQIGRVGVAPVLGGR